ncbi:MAG: glycoside hydrolase family 43 protein [Opitutaceae bacterium]|nr:glycoside hydrolase family 43 protein [Opitutaceae bacterium]
MINNPVLTGFHPDPSICRVGDDFYIATSTFEWWPGVRIHHSRDLNNWRHLAYALDRPSQLEMNGCQNSGGIWAPCLTHADGRFWLVYTNVRHHGSGIVHDTPNYLVTAENIEGPWSDPVYLNSSGFDPSLFHDDDGRKYIVQMQTGEAATTRRFDGILLQEYDPHAQRLLGDPVNIWPGSPIGITEGPHLLKKDGWYYLITAEGGTAARHAVSICRSRSLQGPYEIHPQNPILTAFQKDNMPLWSTGHACFVDTPRGEWFTVHLCHRPLQRPGRLVMDRETNKCAPLGRETAIQALRWDADGWPRLAHGDNSPRLEVPVNLPAHPWPEEPATTSFTGPALPHEFNTLREPPHASWLAFTRRPGSLSLRGRDSLTSNFDQSVVARRLCHLEAEAETFLRFSPANFKQAAGLIAYYDHFNYHYLRVTGAGPGKAKIGVYSSEYDKLSRCEAAEFPVETAAAGIRLRVEMRRTELRFFYAFGRDGDWQAVDRVFEATMLGEWASPQGGFTGTFWGVCCQDIANRSAWVDFEDFRYQPL